MSEQTAPSDYTTAGLLMLISGVWTLLVSLIGCLILISGCFTIILVPWYFIPIGCAVYEIMGAVKAQSGTKEPGIKTNAIVGLVGGVTSCNIISIVLEIVALVMIGKPDVEAYINSSD